MAMLILLWLMFPKLNAPTPNPKPAASNHGNGDGPNGDPTLINSELEAYLQITPEQIKDAVNKYLNTDNRALLEVFPAQVG